MRRVDLARRGGHCRIKLQDRLWRLLLVPQRHRQHAAGSQRAHVGLHSLLGVGEFFRDGEAARIGEADRIRQAEVDNVKALIRVREEVTAVVVDDANLGQDVAGELSYHIGVKPLEHGPIALGDRHILRAGMERNLGRDAAAELDDERLRRRLNEVRVDHRQETEVGGFLVGQIAHDADRAVAVDVEAEIGIGRHGWQIEAGVVGQAGGEVQIGARIDLEEAEWRSALVNLFRIRKFAGVGHAFVVVRRERLETEGLRDDEMAREGDKAGDQKRNERHAPSRSKRPGQTGCEPQRQWGSDQIGGRQDIHRQKEHQAAQSSAGEVGEVHSAESAVAPQKDTSQEKRARQERRQLRQKDRQQLPLLRRVRDEEDRVETEMLHIKVGADRERAEQGERNSGRPAPVASEPVLGDGHHRTRQAEAQHRQAHHQRAEMRPTADGKDAHDVDLQRDDGAGG